MPDITCISKTTNGFETIEVHTGALAFETVPALGGKLTSLRDERTGREWLWRNPRIRYQRVPHGSSYVQYADTGGWDECFPSVSQCEYPSAPWKGAMVQDHGELWSQDAVVTVTRRGTSPQPSPSQGEGVKTSPHSQTQTRFDEPSSASAFVTSPLQGEVVIQASWSGVAMPYRFERTITARENSGVLKFDYVVTNMGDSPLEWIWSAHPLLAIEPGMRLLTPPAARFHLGSMHPNDLLAQREGLNFPLTVRGVDLTTLPQTDAGMAIKLWSDALTEGWATVRATDGEFRMRWNVSQLPQLGIWMNLGAWSGDGGAPYYNMGVEPCIGAQDSLAQAVTEYHLFETLPPQGVRSWGLEIELAAHTNASA